jgi:hypothetical protein
MLLLKVGKYNYKKHTKYPSSQQYFAELLRRLRGIHFENHFLNLFSFIMVSCYVFFEVRSEFLNTIRCASCFRVMRSIAVFIWITLLIKCLINLTKCYDIRVSRLEFFLVILLSTEEYFVFSECNTAVVCNCLSTILVLHLTQIKWLTPTLFLVWISKYT